MMFLTQEEVEELTGKKYHTAISSALSGMGIDHKTRPDGRVIVLRAVVEKSLGLSQPKINKKAEPNWDYLNA